MHDAQIDLLPRVRRLEMLLGVALFFALASTAGLGFCLWKESRPDLSIEGTLTAQAVELRAEDGKVLGRFSAQGQAASLEMRGTQGKPQVKLTSAGIGGSLELLTRDGGQFARLGPGHGPGPALNMHASTGKRILYLGCEDGGDGNLTLGTKEGNISVVLRNNDGHGGGVGLYRDDAHILAFLGGGTRDDGVLQIYDVKGRDYARILTDDKSIGVFQVGRKGHGMAELALDEDDQPYLSMVAPGNKSYAFMTAAKEGGEWKLGDTKGRLRAMAGWVKDGTMAFKLFGADKHEVAIACENSTGGFFQTYARNGNATFSAGCDDTGGSGQLSLFHSAGSAILWAGEAGDYEGGALRLKDLDGTVRLRIP